MKTTRRDKKRNSNNNENVIDENHNLVVEMITSNNEVDESDDDYENFKKVSQRSRAIKKKKPTKKEKELKNIKDIEIETNRDRKYFPDESSNSSSNKSLVVVSAKQKSTNSTTKKATKTEPKKSTVKTPKKEMEKKEKDDGEDEDSDEDDDDDWEEVKLEEDQSIDEIIAKMSRDPIQIQIEGKKKKKKFDFAAYMQRIYKTFQRKMSIEIHKTHLLGWLYHGIYVNGICANEITLATTLSVCSQELLVFQNAILDSDVLKQLLETVKSSLNFVGKSDKSTGEYKITLEDTCESIAKLKCRNNLEYILLTLAIMRALKLKCRLTISFNVVSIKGDAKSAKSSKTNKGGNDENNENNEEKEGEDSEKMMETKNEESRNNTKKRKSSSVAAKKDETEEIKKRKSNVEIEVKEDTSNSSEDKSTRKSRRSLVRKCKEPVSYDEDKLEKNKSSYIFSNDEDFIVKKPKSSRKKLNEEDEDNVKSVISDQNDESLESVKNSKLKRDKPLTKNGLVLSEDDECQDLNADFKDYLNYWIEVYLDKEEMWVPVEPVQLKINCASFLEKRLTNPIYYVCSFDNDNKVKDVTKRYATAWNTHTRKSRIENFDTKFWWENILLSYKPIDLEQEVIENRALEEMLQKQPFPNSISEFKSHPLYVLKRHLLKFQGIYPPDTEPLGLIRNEEIFSRQSCVTLHSKQTWLKYARTVKEGEVAYKIVKGRLKMSEYKMGLRNNPDLELFGFWQTEPFIPPVAVDGKVPRNEYGNVEMFQKSMLPVGCVHLDLPNLNKICKKLNIDCAPAVVGFDAHGGFSHAVYQGWIICEEFKDVVIDAYNEEEKQNELKRIEKEKERIWGNWKKLIRGIQIRERLKEKYDTNHTEKKTNEKRVKIFEAAATNLNDSKNEEHEGMEVADENGNDGTENVSKKGEKRVIDMAILKSKPKTQKRKTLLNKFRIMNEDSNDKKPGDKEQDDEEKIVEEKPSRPRRSTRAKVTIIESENESETETSKKRRSNGKRKSTTNKIKDNNDDYVPAKDGKNGMESDDDDHIISDDEYFSEYFPNKTKSKDSKSSDPSQSVSSSENSNDTNKPTIQPQEDLNLSEEDDNN